MGGTLTGRGGDIIVIDDPHKPEDATSEAKRKQVLDWYGSTLLSRLNDPANGPIIVLQQRIHEEDLAGMLLAKGGWDLLELPAVAEEASEVSLGSRGMHSRKPGDLLHPARFPLELLNRRSEEIGSYIFAAQYQQRPAPLDGGIIKWDWFQPYARQPERKAGERIVQSWNTASTVDEMNDYSVCTTWLEIDGQAYLLDLYRDRLEYPELRRQIETEATRYTAGTLLIEQASSGLSLIQDLRRYSRLNIIGYQAGPGQSHTPSPSASAGRGPTYFCAGGRPLAS